MLAAAEIATSTVESWPEPWLGPTRVSTKTVASAVSGSSFWRTMIFCRLAVDGQCTCRRSSPCTYSRMVWNSSPALISRRVSLVPEPRWVPRAIPSGRRSTRG